MVRYQTVSVTLSAGTAAGITEQTVELLKNMTRCTGIAIVQYGSTVENVKLEVSRNAGKVVQPVPFRFFLKSTNYKNFLPVEFPADDSVLYLKYIYDDGIVADFTFDIILQLTDEPVSVKLPDYCLQSFHLPVTASPVESDNYNLNSEYQHIKGIWVDTLLTKSGEYTNADTIHQLEIRTSSGELILDNTSVALFSKFGKPDNLSQFFPVDYIAAGRNIYFKTTQIGTFVSGYYLDIVLLLRNN